MKLGKVALVAAALFVAAGASHAIAQQVTGAGSTFVYPILAAWSDAYSKQTGIQINYQSIGSGGGIAQIKAGTVDFGASDMPLDPHQLEAANLAQFPLVIGGVVPVVHLPDISPGELRLSGPLLADIFLGKVKRWDAPEIAAMNPGRKLPHLDITVVHRSDGSGTTFNFVDYLAKVSPEWKAKVGVGTSVAWPTGIGGKGNEGVAAYVQRVKGALGYVEYAYVLQNKLTYALVQNSAGEFPLPNAASFQAAAASADWDHAPDFYLVMTNAPGPNAYPITATSFILMHRDPKDAAHSAAALAFFQWALEHGQHLAETLNYVPLPPALVSRIEAYWRATIHVKF